MRCLGPLLCALAVAGPAPAGEPAVELHLDAARLTLDGSLRFADKPAAADRVDLRDDLGLTAPAAACPDLRVGLRWEADAVHVGAGRLAFAGRGTPAADRRWNETALRAGETVETTLDLLRIGAGYERELAREGPFSLAMAVGADYRMLTVGIESPSGGRDDDHLGTFAPSVSLRPRWAPCPGLAVEAGGQVAGFSTGTTRVRGWSADITVRGTPIAFLTVTAGWGLGALDLQRDDDREANAARLRTEGAHLGIEASF